jgi:hypothetical protein
MLGTYVALAAGRFVVDHDTLTLQVDGGRIVDLVGAYHDRQTRLGVVCRA